MTDRQNIDRAERLRELVASLRVAAQAEGRAEAFAGLAQSDDMAEFWHGKAGQARREADSLLQAIGAGISEGLW